MPRSAFADTLTLHDLDLRLYPRVVEIRDGLLALRPYVDPVVMERARAAGQEAGLSWERIEALVEATCIASALQARNTGRCGGQAAAYLSSSARGDVDSEAAALVRVAHYYGHSPLVSGIPGHRRTPGKFSLLHEHHEERVSV